MIGPRLAFLIWLISPAAVFAAPSNLRLTPYIFEAADGTKVEARLGILTVPENRTVRGGNTIELAFVLFPSTSKRPGPPVVYLAGGPGGSGVESARGSRFPLFMAMRESGDVIALDPRGVRRAKPFLLCFERFDYPMDKAPSWEGYLETARSQSENCAWFWRELQRVDLAGYNTNEAADDLEDLRRALGAKTIDLWAISHGTHVALTAMRRHPRGIGRAILAGIEGPDHTLKLPSNVQEHLEDIDDLVRADPGMTGRIGKFTDLMREVLERYRKEPVTVQALDAATGARVPVTVNEFVLQLYTAGLIGTSTIGDLPSIYHAALQGDVTGLAEWWLRTARAPLGNALSFVMDCASGATAARRVRIAREARDALLGSLADYYYPDVCSAWGGPDLGDAFRQPVRFDGPTLFISGTLDGRTPVSNAEEVRAGFSRSTHLIPEGAVHSDPLFLSSPRIKDTMLSFLRGEPLPPDIRIAVSPPSLRPLDAAAP